MNRVTSSERNTNCNPLRSGLDREKVPIEPCEKREVDRKNNPNLHFERQLIKRLPPPLKKDQNKEVTQKPKHFGRKEEVTPKQQEPKVNQPIKTKVTDRSKEISPHPNPSDYHTVSISQRNKQNNSSVAQANQGAYKKDERDNRMKKKVRSEYEKHGYQQQPALVTSIKKQASPSGQKLEN